MKLFNLTLVMLSIITLASCQWWKTGPRQPDDESAKKSGTQVIYLSPSTSLGLGHWAMTNADYEKDRKIKSVTSNQTFPVTIEFKDSYNNLRSFKFSGVQSCNAFNDLMVQGTWHALSTKTDGVLNISVEWERTY